MPTVSYPLALSNMYILTFSPLSLWTLHYYHRVRFCVVMAQSNRGATYVISSHKGTPARWLRYEFGASVLNDFHMNSLFPDPIDARPAAWTVSDNRFGMKKNNNQRMLIKRLSTIYTVLLGMWNVYIDVGWEVCKIYAQQRFFVIVHKMQFK